MKNKSFYSQKTFFIVFIFFTLTSLSQNIAVYDFVYTSTWNSADHGELPNSPHWSDLVGTTHNSDVTFWQIGLNATAGIKDVAEEGNNINFENEVNNAINKGDATRYLEAYFTPFTAISSVTLSNIEVSTDKPLLTLASMIAPSPDWFIGVNSFSLIDSEGNWKAQDEPIIIDIYPLDAGTDSGTSYGANNTPTVPAEAISMIGTQYGFNGNKIGSLSITFKGIILSVEDELANNKIPNIYPNPVNHILTLDNLNNYNVLEMYDQIGRRLFKKKLNQVASYTFNTNSYNKGLYFIKLTDKNNNHKVNKILLQ